MLLKEIEQKHLKTNSFSKNFMQMFVVICDENPFFKKKKKKDFYERLTFSEYF